MAAKKKKEFINMNGHKFWTCLLLISCVMCIVTGHQMIGRDRHDRKDDAGEC